MMNLYTQTLFMPLLIGLFDAFLLLQGKYVLPSIDALSDLHDGV
jgi:hypothetical protein